MTYCEEMPLLAAMVLRTVVRDCWERVQLETNSWSFMKNFNVGSELTYVVIWQLYLTVSAIVLLPIGTKIVDALDMQGHEEAEPKGLAPKVIALLSIIMDPMALQPVKALEPMLLTRLGRTVNIRPDPINAEAPIEVRTVGRSSAHRREFCWKAKAPITTKLEPKFICVRRLQPEKALSPMIVTLDMVTLSRPTQPAKPL